MFSGSTIMACLLLAANAGAPEPAPITYLNTRKFALPLHIQEERKNDIKELLVYVSRNEGQDWTPQKAENPNQATFPFTAPADGTYWFTVAIVNRHGKQEPPVVSQASVSQKIIIDTVKPEIHLRAERRDGQIQVHWEISEQNPDPSTLKLEYQLVDAGPTDWYPVGILTPQPVGDASFPTLSPAAVKVRMTLKDMAKNVGVEEAFVPGTGPSGVLKPQIQAILPPSTQSNPPSLPDTQYPPVPPGNQIVPTVGGNHSGQGYSPSNLTGPLPQLTVVKGLQVKLDFEVARCGPSGLGKADVYLTTDEGQHWERSQSDVPVVSEGSNYPSMGGLPIQASVAVTLPRTEVIYGIYVIVKSGAGLGEPPPPPGRLPQMRVEVDTQEPFVELLLPSPDPTRVNGVIFYWRAADRNLEANPITLQYAPTLAGPWIPISSSPLPNNAADIPPNMPNRPTGKFAWTVPSAPELPNGQAYLRIIVRDLAGNTSVATTVKPVVFDTTLPSASNFSVKAVAP